ncbi:MAG: hypothetical protein JO309_15460 [Pseudonocardiales bacterium]|nr:hypothetical protein [Pseudonocardiales bacterium]
MTGLTSEEFRGVVRLLHRTKDAAYRDAWKKRGEVMSIMANIARKVDRLEYTADGAPVAQDESLLDTAVDLLVYSLKYQTYLADQHATVAAMLFDGNGTTPPFSDGPGGFEVALSRLDVTPLDQIEGPDVPQATQCVLAAFADLEACFPGTPAPIDRRVERVLALTRAATALLGALRRQLPERYRDFLATSLKETG